MIVVTGATGNVGRTVVRLLAEAGEQVTAVARRITDADVPQAVRAVTADLVDPDSVRPALDGADALFFVVPGELSVAGDSAQKILHLAKQAAVRRIVLLSSLSAASRPQSPGAGQWMRALEGDVRDSGLEWTLLRPGGFASNTFASAESIRTNRTMVAPFGDVGLPLIDPDDIAAVAAAVLRESGHGKAVYELTGPELISPRQIAAAIGQALDEPVQFVEQTREEARGQMLTFMPEGVADGTLDIIGNPNRHELQISPDVERVTGRPAHTFAAWAERNAAAFR
jgi:uncharacterized protein YbjT (DUF2867 family)